ncbi:MAG: hypothetical protein AB7F43_00535 [Bacteriovoracia bacterium]
MQLRVYRHLVFILVLVILSGCTRDEIIDWFNDNLGKTIGLKLEKSTDKKQVGQQPKEDVPTLDQRRVNGEFLKELYKVVLEKDLNSEAEFVRLMNVLDQGGHYDGLYNGIVYSSEYREKAQGVASARSLRFFVDTMVSLSKETEAPQVVEVFEKEGINQSVYFLKRRLGEEVLKTIELKADYREKLASWYGKFTVQVNHVAKEINLDLGFPQRSNNDEMYHYRWALEADFDRISWECLNRIHRVLNALQ